MGYMDEYKFWLESDCFDEKTKEELRSIADDDKEIQDRFYKNLKFGTGGMRGIMGAGTNRIYIQLQRLHRALQNTYLRLALRLLREV